MPFKSFQNFVVVSDNTAKIPFMPTSEITQD